MNVISYLLDENVTPVYRIELLKHEPQMRIWQVGVEEAPPFGTLDPAILEWCEELDFVLVTNNRRSMPVHLGDHLAQDRHVPGIFILNHNMGVGATLEELLKIWRNPAPEKYRDNLVYLPVTG